MYREFLILMLIFSVAFFVVAGCIILIIQFGVVAVLSLPVISAIIAVILLSRSAQ